MKKLILLLLCILLLAGCAQTYDGPTESTQMLTEYEVRHYSTFPMFSGSTTMWTSRSVFSYDIHGNQVQVMDYRDGELVSKTVYTYDERGNRTSTTVWDHTGWIPLIDSRTKQTFDAQDRVLTIENYDLWGRKIASNTYSYDDEANTMTWHGDGGREAIYYYDENGQELRDISTGAGGTYETVYEYDDRGNRIGWTSTRDGAPFDRYESGYDEQGRLIWGTHYDETGAERSHVTYTYDDEANTRTTFKDDGGKRIEYFGGDGNIHLIEDYDSEGNLSMIQQYFYRGIQVPANTEEG